MNNIEKLEKFYIESDFNFKIEQIVGLSSIVREERENLFLKKIELVEFISVAESSEIITKDFIQNFSNACFEYAKKNYHGKGLGNNSGLASFALLLGNKVDSAAKEFCHKKSKHHWASRQIPIIYDTEYNTFHYYSGWQIWGGAFNSHYLKISKNTMDIVKNVIL